MDLAGDQESGPCGLGSGAGVVGCESQFYFNILSGSCPFVYAVAQAPQR